MAISVQWTATGVDAAMAAASVRAGSNENAESEWIR
jgi:hypothetical protein